MKFSVAVAVPSYKRERWLFEHFIDNMYEMLLKPLNDQISGSGLFRFHIYVQDVSSEWKDKLIEKISTVDFIDLVFTDIAQGTKMTELRCRISQDIIEKDDTITHIMMSDDDLGIMANDRLINHYINLFNSDHFLNQTAIFVGKPSSGYSITNVHLNGPHIRGKNNNNLYLNLIRFQCFPVKYFNILMTSEWNKLQKLYQIDNGEDQIIMVLIYIAMFSELGDNGKFLNIFGFDELFHFANTMNSIDVLSNKFKSENPGLSNEYYYKAKEFVTKICLKYTFNLNGFIRTERQVNSRKIFYDLYPHIHTEAGLLNIKPNTIISFLNNNDYTIPMRVLTTAKLNNRLPLTHLRHRSEQPKRTTRMNIQKRIEP